MLKLITELQAIAQSGLTYCKDHYDIDRFKRIIEISAELVSLNSTHKYEDILELFNKETGYATPKIDVRGAVFQDGKILLVREKADNLWSLPGGWADVNLSASENTLKEIIEETGYKCKIIKLIAIYDKSKHNPEVKWPYAYRIFFLCEAISNIDEFDLTEIHEIGFFSLDEIPELSQGRVNIKQIETCFEHCNNPNLPTYFD